MNKIPTVFERDFSKKPALVTPAIKHGCEWVLSGEGTATRKYDGACCAVLDGAFVKRREIKDEDVARAGLPPGFIETEHDATTGKRVGWVPVGDGPEDKWFREALPPDGSLPAEGTYELLGPKVQGNPENFGNHTLLKHTDAEELDAPCDYDGLREYLTTHNIEGIVWHHPDGRMAKLKGKDFGARRPRG